MKIVLSVFLSIMVVSALTALMANAINPLLIGEYRVITILVGSAIGTVVALVIALRLVGGRKEVV